MYLRKMDRIVDEEVGGIDQGFFQRRQYVGVRAKVEVWQNCDNIRHVDDGDR